MTVCQPGAELARFGATGDLRQLRVREGLRPRLVAVRAWPYGSEG
jgi:hypothetical protein